MLKIEITVNTDNAAFKDSPYELESVLAQALAKVIGPTTEGRLLDINGNSVGTWKTEQVPDG